MVNPTDSSASDAKVTAHQQKLLKDVLVKGVVLDEKNSPLLGATVTLKGTGTKTSTDVNGLFRIQAPLDSTLVITYVGYVTKEVRAAANLTVNLQPVQKSLNEVVVVAYGTQLKQHVTGAIASVGTAELQQSPVANLSNALAGRLPGLVTQQFSGEPGADGAALNIRGFGTTNSNNPLVIVDGVQRDFAGLDANEIASISILKDAASTAIYGIQGANGVILVTTRRGKTGAPEITVSAQNGWQSPTAMPQYVDSYTGLHLYKEGLINDGLFSDTSAYSDVIINKYRERQYPAYQYIYPNVNWAKTMLKPYSDMAQGNLNVTGGNASAKYFVSLSYLQQNGLYNYDNAINQYDVQAITNKYNFRTNFDISITKRLTMELDLGAIIYDQNYPGQNASTIFSAIQSTPAWYYPVTNPDGSVGAAPNTSASPYADVVESGFQRNFSTELQSTAGFKYDLGGLVKGLSARVRLSFDNNNYRNVAQPLSYTSYQFALKPGVPDTVRNLAANGAYNVVNQGNGTLGYNVNANGSRRTELEAYLNYDRDFGKSTLNSMFIYQQSSYFDAVATGNYEGGLPYKYQGLLGRTSYAYDNKYLAEIDFGYNGSENFAPGHRFGFFPAVSAGWIISNESFIKNDNTFKFINLLKLRGSFGLVGNDQGQTRFLYLSTWSTSGYGYTFGQNDNGASYWGAQEGQAGNVELTWEKSRKLNVGLDIGLWNNELSLTADAFKEHRTDILTTAQQLTPQFAGLVYYPSVNAGIVNNEGFELSLTHKHNFS
ncbi:MAG: SusC/RagA family TonB-linked outer membrane protein, partial [Mucilaginibacter sp.]